MRRTLAILTLLAIPGAQATREAFNVASWYGPRYHGRQTASGAVFDQNRLTAAHKTLPFGTIMDVCRGRRCVRVEINDRGPFIEGRDIDLSYAAAEEIGLLEPGVAPVETAIVYEPEAD